MNSPHELCGWYWRLTAAFLTYGFFWNPIGYCLAGILTIVHLAHFIWTEKSLTAFTVQTRVCYLFGLIIASPEPMQLLFVLPLVGTWTFVLSGYCFLARLLTLLPWNRTWPLNASRIWAVLTMPPEQGRQFDLHAGDVDLAAIGCEGSRPLFPGAPPV